MQDPIYQNMNNPIVRDLYWLLFSESPLSDAYNLSPYTLFPLSILNEWKALSHTYFSVLEKNPGPLLHFVDRKKNKRLGFYAEALLSYFFQTFDAVELLLQNVQIIEAQKTIGEVDFIILYKGKIIHLECAVKYYLLKNPKHKNEASQWVGPRLKDNLALKLNRLIRHQLPLGKRKEIQHKINGKIDCSFLFFKGLFFTETEIGENEITNGNSNQFVRQNALQDYSYQPIQILQKPNWLSAMHPQKNKVHTHSIELKEQLKHPELILFDDNNVRFIVPKDWGK